MAGVKRKGKISGGRVKTKQITGLAKEGNGNPPRWGESRQRGEGGGLVASVADLEPKPITRPGELGSMLKRKGGYN